MTTLETIERTRVARIPLGPGEPAPAGAGVGLELVDVSRHEGGRQLLHDLSLSIRPGEMVALMGGSGSGKTTLLETMAGLHRPTSGTVTYDGRSEPLGTGEIGFVPQEDIIHRGLPLGRTLRYAARLRLPAGTSPDVLGDLVESTLRDLDLLDRSNVPVGALSGGQRKRASVGVELLTRPRLFLLDEPTSGLDPSTAAEVLAILRRLADRGVTVVLTTHDPADAEICDRVVFLAPDGHLAFSGSPGAARQYFEVDDLARAFTRLAREGTPGDWAERFASNVVPAVSAAAVPRHSITRPAPGVGRLRQFAVLTRRSADLCVRSRLTLAVLLGSPLLVITMMAVLFRPGGFAGSQPGAIGPVQTIFWIAFAGFFFGLTYGLLQIVGEYTVFKRERLAGLSVVAYVASKVAMLLPLLVAVDVTMLGVLRALDRLPAAGWGTYALLAAVLVAESLCALALGLLASAAVGDAAQATLALPMICFPQVLFAGAVVPVADMTPPGRLISAAMLNRWAFEALGRELLGATAARPVAMTAAYREALTGPAATGCIVLAVLAIAAALGAMGVLRARTRTADVRPSIETHQPRSK